MNGVFIVVGVLAFLALFGGIIAFFVIAARRGQMQQKQKVEELKRMTTVYKSFAESNKEEERVFCSYCGIKNSKDAKQCSHCKAPIGK